MKAIKVVGVGEAKIQDVPVPKIPDDNLLIKVTAVALNPTDWKHVHYEGAATPGTGLGCDFAGIVEQIGSKVTKQHKEGDHVFGFTHGANALRKEDGAFAEYAIVKGDITTKVPPNLTDEEAATLGVGVVTCGQGLYQSLGLPLPGSGKYDGYVFIYGGSTATGTLAIQYAKLSGAKVVTTCSPRNFKLVKGLGAEEAFDYNEAGVGAKIREYTKDSITKVFDCISEGQSIKICEEALSSKGGKISDLLPTKHERSDIETQMTLGYTFRGEPLKFFGQDWAARPEDFEFGKKWWDISAKLLADGQITVHPLEVREGGLPGVLNGLNDLKDGKVSGKKLVYRIAGA